MNARRQAYELIYAHKVKGQYVNLGLKDKNLRPIDRGFVTHLVYSSIQNYDWMKVQFQHYLEKEVPIEVEIVLVMGCVQRYLMASIVDYALVNESVNLVKQIKPSYSGLVNAILKKVAKQELIEPSELWLRYSHPEWMVKLFLKQLGAENTLKLLAHDNTIAPLYCRLNGDVHWQDYPISQNEKGHLVADGTIFQTDALSSGKVVIQDIASQEVVKMFNPIKGRVLDACGAPGTKASQLAKLYPETEITLLDLHSHRVELSKLLMARLGITNVSAQVGDATTYEGEQFDAILCDVPCSGLGVLRRKPDLRTRILPSDLDSLQQLQAEILENMDKLLKKGGQLVYSTCTLNRKENELQIEKFLAKHPEYTLVKEQTLYPWLDNSDGFYMAHLVK